MTAFIKRFSVFLFFILDLHALSAQNLNRTSYVNPFVGTGGHGHTFPGATTPFGMVQLSPDTRIDGSWDGCGGYHYSDSFIYGFSHTHLSGTGVSDYGDILIMPQTGKTSFDPQQYKAVFSHKNEIAKPGYYSVIFNNGIKAELTASTHVGMHRYTFPEKSFSVVIDLQHRDKLLDYKIEFKEYGIGVKRVSRAWAVEQHCYGYLQFSLPYQHEFNSDSSKLILHFNNSQKQLLVKCGISFTGIEGAYHNLDAEKPDWDFDECVSDANNFWIKELNHIVVEDRDEEKLKVFFTALYHTMVHPNIAMDYDGLYRGMDNQIHQADNFTYYSVFSLWDTFRAFHPLYTLLDPERVNDFIKTMLTMYQQGGRLPVWELCANETDCMIGYHSVSVIADAVAKIKTDFNKELAFEAMKKSANWNHLGLPEYSRYHFLSIDDEHESVSKTLEYAYDDWCIAQMAKALNKTDEYEYYLNRSNAWRNLFDPETHLMRPRKNGGWLTPFDPREVNNYYTEGNSWQYSFFVPQNIPGLIEATGGNAAFEKHLDSLFTAPEATTGRSQPDISGMIGQYAHGNEPSHHIAYLYNYVRKPEKTKAIVHRVLKDFYTNAPDGLIGNEDCGQMSAWYVMSALGIYAVTPGIPEYQLVEPYLDRYEVNPSIFSFTDTLIRNRLKSGKTSVTHSELLFKKGDDFRLEEPSTFIPSPVFYAPNMLFRDSMKVRIETDKNCIVGYKIPGENHFHIINYHEYVLTIKTGTIIEAWACCGSDTSAHVRAQYVKFPHPDWNVKLNCTYNPQYNAGGPNGLIDGLHGDKNWQKGGWQGYQGQDFEAVIDMKKVQPVEFIGITFLQDTRSWIVFPKEVVISTSTDGKNFNVFTTMHCNDSIQNFNVIISQLSIDIDANKSPFKTRYIKIQAKNYGTLPHWHQGAGGEAFIFVDEIEIVN
ncbi:MAG: alpha-mannosidase [Bacteroidetes bacterium]|nr:alpha-mannosidase [Bacteroidota bacterium]